MSILFATSHLKYLCSKYRLTPSKRYGQNFLLREEPIEKMLAAAEISKKDTVVEIGPGFGALTFALAERAGKVIAYEIEKKLQPYWEEQVKKHKNVEIAWGNVLKNRELGMGNKEYKVVANLPYQITSNVLRKFLSRGERDPAVAGEADSPSVMVLMVQKEVAERICAGPGDMSLLAVSVQYYAEPEIIMKVPKTFFWPEPKVDSAVIKLSLRGMEQHRWLHSSTVAAGDRDYGAVMSAGTLAPQPPLGDYGASDDSDDDNEQWFFKVVKAGFAQKRKLLIKNLQPLLDSPVLSRGNDNEGAKEKLEKIFTEMGIGPNIRAQELSVEQWKQLSTLLRDNFVV
ncbi:ribosomal RNA small subunit methyltransferase A [Patescibacteria group bacterium]|nr:MAG: ribosomal RNA small subunit methyltransferase A [Patescibacteria group bacterium]